MPHAPSRHTRTREAASPAGNASYRHLAVRVIDQAFRDLASPSGSAEDRTSARAFLAGSAMLRLWCEVADLNPAWLVARAKQRITGIGALVATGPIEAAVDAALSAGPPPVDPARTKGIGALMGVPAGSAAYPNVDSPGTVNQV